jgi:Mg2+ and Co2+ transporter CorA
MATDAFYALNEIFSFAASSEMHFLNLIDTKLDQYTESTENEFGSLPSLKYTKEILYRHIQKTQQTLDSIRNAKHHKWPKAGTKGRGKTKIAADAIEQDFIHLLGRAEMMHKRCNEAIVVLMSSVSISESKKAIGQASRVARLTFLAFLFVPLSFTTSFFGMNVTELANNRLSIFWWAVVSIPLSILTILLFYWDVTWLFKTGRKRLKQSRD